MPERTTQTEAVRAGTPVTVGSVTLLPIERVVLRSEWRDTSVWFSAAKEPYALIVRDSGGIRAIDAGDLAVSLDELREKVPGLETVLAVM
jgi:hypothetical protein